MPVIGEPPNYAVSKNYLNNLAEIAKYLDLGNIFSHIMNLFHLYFTSVKAIQL